MLFVSGRLLLLGTVVTIAEVEDVAEAASVAELAARTFPLACPPGSAPQDIAAFITEHLSVQRFAAYIADPTRTVLRAEQDSVPIAYSVLFHGSERAQEMGASLRYWPTIELSKFYVLPHWHGGGIAAELMSVTKAAGRRVGARGIWLGVNDRNNRALRFYTKTGFVPVGVGTFQLGRRVERDVIMECAL